VAEKGTKLQEREMDKISLPNPDLLSTEKPTKAPPTPDFWSTNYDLNHIFESSSNSTTNIAKSSSNSPWPPDDGLANVFPPDWSGMLVNAIEPPSAQQHGPMPSGLFNANVLPRPPVHNAPNSQIYLQKAAVQVAHPRWPMTHANTMQSHPQQLDSISPSNLTVGPVQSNDFLEANSRMTPSASEIQDLDEDQRHPAIDGPWKRGWKRKTVPADVKEAKRKEFLERNRVAANRCR